MKHGSILCTTHRSYGMQCAEFEALLARAAGCCEACGATEECSGLGRLIIDHDHRYDREAVRGLICSSCNSQLSVLENYHPYKALAADRRFETYLSRAWFAQVAKYVRAAGHLPYAPDQDFSQMMNAVLRTNALTRLQKAVQQHPELAVSRFGGPGDLRLLVTATYYSATPSRYEITATLRRLQGMTFAFDSMSIVRGGSQRESFADVTEGLRVVRQRLREDVRLRVA